MESIINEITGTDISMFSGTDVEAYPVATIIWSIFRLSSKFSQKQNVHSRKTMGTRPETLDVDDWLKNIQASYFLP